MAPAWACRAPRSPLWGNTRRREAACWGPGLFALIPLLGLVGALAEIWASSAGGKRAGASFWGILGGLVAGFVGFLVFPPFGGVLGVLVGKVGGEEGRVGAAGKD